MMKTLERRLTSADRRIKERQRQLVLDEIALCDQRRRDQWTMKMQEQAQDRQLMEAYKPWGRPGAGAPVDDVRKKKFLEWQQTPHQQRNADEKANVLAMGRPGYGAPLRTRSGRIKTQLGCDPALRFQALAATTGKAVDTTLRYQMSPQEKEAYRKELDMIINSRKKLIEDEKRQDAQEDEGLKWGQPGPGGKPWRVKKLQERTLYQLLGWSLDPRQTNYSTESTGTRWPDITSHSRPSVANGGVELVPLLQSKRVGKPRRDSKTGQLLPNSLPHSDITKFVQQRPKLLPEERVVYRQILGRQLETRQQERQKSRKLDEESTRLHYETWETFWGRPGHGAPCKGHVQREKLFRLLHQSNVEGTPKT